MVRTVERVEFLSAVVVTAVENFGYGWFTVGEYSADDPARAVVRDRFEGREFVIDIDAVAAGVGVISRARPRAFPELVWDADTGKHVDGDVHVLANSSTGDRLYMSDSQRARIMAASRANDAGELDVVDALAVVECGLFGHVEYA